MARKKETNPESIIEGFDFSEDMSVEENNNERLINDGNITLTNIQTEKRKPGRPVGTTRKDPKDKARHFSTTLPPEIVELISDLAEKEDRPVSRIVASAIKFYAEEH